MPPRCAYMSPRSSPYSPSAAALRTGASSSGGAAPVNSTHAGAFHQPAFTSADLPRFSSSWERERAQQPRSRPLGASGLSSCTPESDPRLQVVHLTKTSTGTPQLLTPNGERLDDHLASRATHLAERHQQINDLTAENDSDADEYAFDAEPDADISPLRLRQSSTRTTSDASSPEP